MVITREGDNVMGKVADVTRVARERTYLVFKIIQNQNFEEKITFRSNYTTELFIQTDYII